MQTSPPSPISASTASPGRCVGHEHDAPAGVDPERGGRHLDPNGFGADRLWHREAVDIGSDRRYRFVASRPAVWAALTRVDDYPGWWPWLREFDGDVFATGARWRCVVSPPLPYTVRFELHLLDVVAPESVDARIEGDITGHAHLELTDDGAGCELRLVSELTAVRGAAEFVSRFVPPLASFGHHWVLDNGARQFRDAAFDPAP